MPRHLISDAHEWINEIPTVPSHHLAKSQPRERADESKESDEEFLEPKEPVAPPAPTAAEWIEHQITHMPYKAWCPICVKNAATNNPHRMTHHSRGVAMFCMDYVHDTTN